MMPAQIMLTRKRYDDDDEDDVIAQRRSYNNNNDNNNKPNGVGYHHTSGLSPAAEDDEALAAAEAAVVTSAATARATTTTTTNESCSSSSVSSPILSPIVNNNSPPTMIPSPVITTSTGGDLEDDSDDLLDQSTSDESTGAIAALNGTNGYHGDHDHHCSSPSSTLVNSRNGHHIRVQVRQRITSSKQWSAAEIAAMEWVLDTVHEHEQQEIQRRQKVKEEEEEEVDVVSDHIVSTTPNDDCIPYNEYSYTFGIINCFIITYVFGKYPENFWLLWLIETVLLTSMKMYDDYYAKPLNKILYYVEFCWFATFFLIFSIIVISGIFEYENDTENNNSTNNLLPSSFVFSYAFKKHIYLMVIGMCCGPLLGATAVLNFVATVFHDRHRMTSVIIHLMPVLMGYTFIWHHQEILQTYPKFFTLTKQVEEEDQSQIQYEHDIDNDITLLQQYYFPNNCVYYYHGFPIFIPNPTTGFGTVAGNSMALYISWLVVYVSWMCYIGIDLTRIHRRHHRDYSTGESFVTGASRYDTGFHSTLRNGFCILIGTYCWRRSVSDSIRCIRTGNYEFRDFVILMCLHFLCVWFVISYIGLICCYNKYLYVSMIWILVIITVYRGAKLYHNNTNNKNDEGKQQTQKQQQLQQSSTISATPPPTTTTTTTKSLRDEFIITVGAGGDNNAAAVKTTTSSFHDKHD